MTMKKAEDIRPGDVIQFVGRQNTRTVRRVVLNPSLTTLTLEGSNVTQSFLPGREVEVADPAPRFLSTWDAETQTWICLVDTTAGGEGNLQLDLNDQTVYEGPITGDDVRTVTPAVAASLSALVDAVDNDTNDYTKASQAWTVWQERAEEFAHLLRTYL